MRLVPIARAPNQSFVLTIDNTRWVLTIKEARGVMCVDISRNGELVLSGSRALAGEALIPYRYLQTLGNFIFITIGNENPDWNNFGISQNLIYISPAEMLAIPRVTIGEITASLATIQYLYNDDGFYITTNSGELITDA